MKKIYFYDAKAYDRISFGAENEKHGYEIIFLEVRLTKRSALIAQDAEVVCAFVNDDLSKETLEILQRQGVKLLAMRCAGYNNVDLQYANGRMKVVRVPAYSPYAVAEHAMALLMTLNRKTHKAYNRVRENNFSLVGLTGFDLHGKTIGVIGTGKIGRVFIDICKGFGTRVIAYDPYPIENAGIDYVSLDTIFEESDVISLHCPLTKESKHLINQETIQKCKKGVFLLNTSRGALIHSEALLDGIKSGQIGAAALDVYEEEADVFYEDNSDHILQDDVLARLLTMPNVLVTSHQAFLTKEALENIAETTLNNIDEYFAGEKLTNEVIL